MNDYADTGFLCSLYAPDAHSLRAITLMKRQAKLAKAAGLKMKPA